MDGVTRRSLAELMDGWRLVVACFCGFAFFSLMTAATGVFMEPLGREFGWNRTLLSAGVAIASVATALLSPFFGLLIDRYGSRRVAMPGLVLTGIAICLFALANGSPSQWILLWIVYAIISISVKTTVWTAAISRAFVSARGLALGLTLAGTAAAQIAVPPLATYLIEGHGWRFAFVVLGAGWGAITFLLCLFFLHDRQHPEQTVAVDSRQGPADLPGLTIAEAARSRAIWSINIAALIMMTLTVGFLVHQVPVMRGAGMTAEQAAWLAAIGGAAALLGKLGTGALLDYFNANRVCGILLALTAFGFAFLIDGIRTTPLMILAIAINGYGSGCMLQAASYLTASHAGLRNFGAIFGVLTSVTALGAGIGPLFAGRIYDLTGSYDIFLIGGTIGSLLCGLLILTLPRPVEFK